MVTLAVVYLAIAISGQLNEEMEETRYHDRLLYERAMREQESNELLAARVERVKQAARDCALWAIVEHVDDPPTFAFEEDHTDVVWLALTGDYAPDDYIGFSNNEVETAIVGECHIGIYSGSEFDYVREYMEQR